MSSQHAPHSPGKRAANTAPTAAPNPSEQPTSAEPDSTPVQRFCAELLGTFLLVLFHGGAAASLKVIQRGPDTTASGLVFVALADGFSLFIIIMIIGKVSGVLINPAVTFALAVRGRFAWRDVPYYLVAQFAGASLGAAVILAAMGRDALAIGRLGAVQLAPGVGIWQGILVEALGAFFLVLTISATAEDPRSPSGWAAFTIGVALAAIVLVFAPVTGAPVNPARAFGPNLADALLGLPVNWGIYVGCYLLGPLIGATGASIIYRYLANQPPSKPAAEPD